MDTHMNTHTHTHTHTHCPAPTPFPRPFFVAHTRVATQNTEYARRYVTHMAHQFETMKEQQRVSNSDFLRTQMSEKTQRDKYLAEVVNTNYPTEEFFNQFGTSHR